MPYEPPAPGNLPDNIPLPPQLAGQLLRRMAELADVELEAADLQVSGGDTVRIVCTAEVRGWLRSWAGRAEAGERP